MQAFQCLVRRRTRGRTLLALLMLLAPSVVLAHGGRQPLAFWGLFPPFARTCQRVIGDVVATCASDALAARVACRNAEIDGALCDQQATDSLVEAARIAALNRVDDFCTNQASSQLGFLGVIEVQADVSNMCDRSSTTLVGTLYPTPAVASPATATCQRVTAAAAPRLLRHSNRIWQNTFNRIAHSNLSPAKKQKLLTIARQRIQHGVERMAIIIAKVCPLGDFQLAYGRSLEQLLTAVAQQADCISGAAYVQNAVQCDPTATATPLAPATPTPTPTQG